MIIKSVKNIKLDNEAKKTFKEGVMLDSSLNEIQVANCSEASSHIISKQEKLAISQKVIERENYSNYSNFTAKMELP